MPDASNFPVVPGVEIREIIGRGGFATVYSGFQAAFNRHVAVKVLQRSELDADARQRFDRECQVMGALSNHPYIVTLYDAGYAEGERPYMVMPYVSDGTLDDRIRRGGAMPWREVVRSGVHLAGALETAHRADVLHRDIKPANVLRAEYGDLLGDFGIARIAGGHETQSGIITASIAHAPPEVLEGEPPDARADVYSLGSTLFEALAGRAAFSKPADSVGFGSMIRQILLDPPPTLPPDTAPAAVIEVIERALSKNKFDRHATAAEFGEALQAAERSLSLAPTDMLVLGSAPPAVVPEMVDEVEDPTADFSAAAVAAVVADAVVDANPRPESPAEPVIEPAIATTLHPRARPPVGPESPGTVPPPESATTGNRWLLAGAGVAVVALLAGGGFVLSNQNDEGSAPSTALDRSSVPTSTDVPGSEVSTTLNSTTTSSTTTSSTTPPVDPPIVQTPLTLPAGDPVQIQMLNPGIQTAVLDGLVREFETENPDITVEIIEESSYRSTLQLLLSGAEQPDVALLADRSVQSVLDHLAVLPVQDFIDQDDFDTSVLLSNAADMYSTADGLAAMPFNVAAPMVYANGDLLRQAGIELEPGAELTTAGLLDRCAVLAEVVETCIEFSNVQFLFTELVSNSGGRLFDTDGFAGSATAAGFDNEVGRASFAFFVDTVLAGDARLRSGPRLFDSGESAFHMNTSSGLGSLDSANDAAEAPVDVIAIGLPHLDGVEPSGVMPGGGALWIFDRADGRRSIASWLLVEYLAELPQLDVLHRNSGYVPGRSDAADDGAFADFWADKPVFKAAYDELVEASEQGLPNDRDGRAGPFHEIDVAIADRMKQAQSGESTTDEAFDALVADVNTLLAAYDPSAG